MIAKYRIEIERIASRPPTMKVRRTWLFLLAIAFATCRFRFHQYVPSAWETQWSDAARSEVSVDRECDVMSESFHFERAQFTVWQAQRWAKQTVVNARPPRSFALNAVFSRMQLIDEANGGRIVERFIEPLVGILRDPLTMCANFANESVGRFELTEDAVQAKRFLVHDFETINAMPTHGRLILMDLGASTYSGWGPAVSAVGARWFVERFARNTNVTFDRIIAFESVYIPAEEVFRGLPRQLMGRFQYIHLPVSANPRPRRHILGPFSCLLPNQTTMSLSNSTLTRCTSSVRSCFSLCTMQHSTQSSTNCITRITSILQQCRCIGA
jgi:hypothetical protein